MRNPESGPTTRVGRMPTFKGHSHTVEAKTRISKAQKDKPKSPEEIRKRSTVWLIIEPFYARGGLRREIAYITGLSDMQVTNAIQTNNEWPEGLRVKPFDDGGPSRREKAFRLRERLKQPLSDDQKKSLAFARMIFKCGLILPNNLEYWKRLHKLFMSKSKELPESFADKLNLEFFLRARIELGQGKNELMGKYSNMVVEIDSDWFKHLSAERRLIVNLTSQPAHNGRGSRPGSRRDEDLSGMVTLAQAARAFDPKLNRRNVESRD